jgi:hypothetical protein
MPEDEKLFRANLDHESTSISSDNNAILNEKSLLKSVESLIVAIKSGQLKKEQEQSNRRIFEILGTILDRESLMMFDSMFNDLDSILNQENITENEPSNIDIKVDKPIDEIIDQPSNGISEKLSLNQSEPNRLLDKSSSLFLDKERDSPQKSRQSQRQKELLKAETVYILDPSVNTTLKTIETVELDQSYEREMELYLASLPKKVTYEDVLNAPTKKIKMISRTTFKEQGTR